MIKEREAINSPITRPTALLCENVQGKEVQTSLVPIGGNKPAGGGKSPIKRGGRYAIEREIHRKALSFYFSLGPSRTLAQVARNFGVKESVVTQWSSCFDWKEKVQKLENRSIDDEFKEKAMELLVLLLDSFSKRDEETGRMVLTSTEKSIVERLKLAVDAFKRLRDDSREGDPDPEGGGGQNGPGKGKNQVMVNVIIKK